MEQNPVDIIATKRDGRRLDADQIEWFISRYADGSGVADEQAAALAMAIYFQGLDADELAVWTRAMIDSGTRLDLGAIGRPTVDKHSTGGVGDKISLILVPLVAACGPAVPQLSGRGLGHTGGTLDKMEAIPGWEATIEPEVFRRQLQSIGGVIAGASEDLAPADRKLYALRDITATVESIPLIASSIMSKKIAEGCESLVLDVKVGSGAFMPDLARATELAETMVGLGAAHGVETRALLTSMDDILGRTAGNALEVEEALDVLAGGGPPDVAELTVALAREMLDLAGVATDPAEVLASGRALEVFHAMVEAQGGRLGEGLPRAEHVTVVSAESTGHVTRLEARRIGVAAWRLGAGRARKEDPVSPTAGVRCLVDIGDAVVEGQPLIELHADQPDRAATVRPLIEQAIGIADHPAEPTQLVLDRVTAPTA